MLNKLPKDLLCKIIVERENIDYIDYINDYDELAKELKRITEIQVKIQEKMLKTWRQKTREVMSMIDPKIVKHINDYVYQDCENNAYYVSFTIKKESKNNNSFDCFLFFNYKCLHKEKNGCPKEHYQLVRSSEYRTTIFRNKEIDYHIRQSSKSYTLEEFITQYPEYEHLFEIISHSAKYVCSYWKIP